MNKKYLLKLLKELNNNISFYYWKYYNNFVLENLYNKDIYNSIIDFNWKCILNLKQLKKYYIKNKLELISYKMKYKTFKKYNDIEKFIEKLHKKYDCIKYDIVFIHNGYWLYYIWLNSF